MPGLVTGLFRPLTLWMQDRNIVFEDSVEVGWVVGSYVNVA